MSVISTPKRGAEIKHIYHYLSADIISNSNSLQQLYEQLFNEIGREGVKLSYY